MSDFRAVVVGAGPAGISAALSLQDHGIQPLLIDRAGKVAVSWRNRYDRLRLNTGRQFSHLPGRPYPKGTPLYPTRDDVVDHLERYVHEDGGIEMQLDTDVVRIDRRSDGWRLVTSSGDIDADQVVIATGHQHTPVIPGWKGHFSGELLHSSEYRNPAPYQGKKVLVAGSGSSGMEIAHDLATGGAATVWLSVRTPPNIMVRRGPAGLPVDVMSIPLFRLSPALSDRVAAAARRRAFGDLAEFGLPVPQEGPFTRAHRTHATPTVVDREVIDAVRDGSVTVVGAVIAFEGDTVFLANSSIVDPDVVIAATGYGQGLSGMVGHLGVLGPDGTPSASSADGLYFHGFEPRPALIGHVARTSRPLARRIAARR